MFGYKLVKKEELSHMKLNIQILRERADRAEEDARLYNIMKRNIEHSVKSIFTGRPVSRDPRDPYNELMKMLKEFGVFE